jgi:hypothetical protein
MGRNWSMFTLALLYFVKGICYTTSTSFNALLKTRAWGWYMYKKALQRKTINQTESIMRVKSHDRPIHLIIIVLFLICDAHSLSIRRLNNKHRRRLL